MTPYLSIKILISLLKQYNIHNLVLSPGARNIPFVAAVETDPFFKCYSVVDERNAAFFALGISQQLNQPVALACTSGTAVSNYLSGLTEAYFSHCPIVAITFDRSPYSYNQLETQKIDHIGNLQTAVKFSADLPLIKDFDDAWYCQRIINEAFISMQKDSFGPVHINLPICGGTNELNWGVKDSKGEFVARKINYYTKNSLIAYGNNKVSDWDYPLSKLKESSKIMLVLGQTINLTEETKEFIRKFCKKTNCVVLADNMCNFRCDTFVPSEAIIKAMDSTFFKSYLPEIVITAGMNFQERIKDLFKSYQGEYEHWGIDSEGYVRDVFKSQTALFDSSLDVFFDFFSQRLDERKQSKSYYDIWAELYRRIHLGEVPYSNIYVISKFGESIPNDAICHLSILNATRIMQFVNLNQETTVYGNINAFGIDGCLPTFLGQAYSTSKLSFLVIGDLSFIYGMNSLAIKHIKENVRILLVNNKGAAEFHIQPESNKRPMIDLHIGCAHNFSMKAWAESVGFKYISAHDKDSFDINLKTFISDSSEIPILYEVFTNMRSDGELCLSLYRNFEKSIKNIKSEY